VPKGVALVSEDNVYLSTWCTQ